MSLLPTVIEIDLTHSRRGLPSLLGESLGGRTILSRTLEGIHAAGRVAAPVLVVGSEDAERVRGLAPDRELALFVHDFDDIACRGRLRRGRLWGKEGWRGGVGDSYFVCEAGNPAALEALYRQEGWQSAMVIPAEAPFLDPALVDAIAGHYLDERGGAPVYLSAAPPGLAGDILSLDVLGRFRERACSVERVFPFRPDRPEHDPELARAFHSFEEGVATLRGRLTVDSRTALEGARQLWQLCGGGGAGERIPWVRLRRALEDDPDLLAGPLPEEMILELGGDGGGALRARRGRAGGVIPDAVWESVLAGIGGRDDSLITLGGGYHDPVRDPRLESRILEARAAGALGIHLRTPGAALDGERSRRLLDSGPDVITIDLVAGSPEDLRLLTPETPSYEERLRGLESLLEARLGLEDPPFILVGIIFDERTLPRFEDLHDRWFGRADRVLTRGPEGPRGEASPHAVGVFAPPDRFPCKRLVTQMRVEFDGSVPLCDRDPELEARAGSLLDESVAEIWQGRLFRRAREAHRRREWGSFHHCGACVSWFRFD
ncbi:MAG: SPASM domain-containing protein [Planctomycetota bacterium]